MRKELQNDLYKMGKGWFVLKIAEEHGITTKTPSDYGKASAMHARLQRYEKTKEYHKDILTYLVDNWSVRLSAGNPVIPNSVLHEYALKTLHLL